MNRRSLAALVTILVLAGSAGAQATATAPATAEWTEVWDHWYQMELAGAPAGWRHERMSERGGEYRSDSEMLFRLRRGPANIEISMRGTFIETRTGEPVSLHSVQNMGQQPLDRRWEFNDDHVLSTTKGARLIEERLPLPEGRWLTPMAVHRYLKERMEAGAKEITYRTIDEENGLDPVTMTHVWQADEKLEVEGRVIPVTVWKSSTSIMPEMHSMTRVSADGHLVSDEISIPFGTMKTRLTTRTEAMAAAGGPAPEMMLRTFVTAEPPIARVRETTASTLRLRTREGPMLELPSAGAQRFELEPGEQSALLRININENVPVTADDGDAPEYRKPSSMVDSDDQLIRKLAASAARGSGDDPRSKAEALRAFVQRHISAKSLDTAFATASETARMRTGDCSEHAVLLCAMARASGIPARIASGLVYADYFGGEKDIFGWHMWTQMVIDDRWVDFDATLDQRFDAAHVLTGTTSLADGLGGMDMAPMMMLMGNLEIEVVDVSYAD